MTRLFVTADDRTGALEVGGIIATPGNPVPVGPTASAKHCCVVDIDSRQRSAALAAERICQAHGSDAQYRAHKMDSGLRGNWAAEVFALASKGHSLAIVPSYPDAGRTCVDGTVYIHGNPVLQSTFADDPFTRPVSSRPADVLQKLECLHDNIVIWDAADNEELQAAAKRCVTEQRIMVGPTGAIGAYAHAIFASSHRLTEVPPGSLLIVNGSLNQTSRDQIQAIRSIEGLQNTNADFHILETPQAGGSVSTADADTVGRQLVMEAKEVEHNYDTLLIIGGDTCKTYFGNDELQVFGMIAPGIPISRWRDKTVITKGGGIGTVNSLTDIVAAGRAIATKN